ncbi:hypothetical protein [Methylogaea oryzae]|nr:hypothetical protein [Methylogaea oryzae]
MNRLQRDTESMESMSLNDLFRQDIGGLQALAVIVGLYLVAWCSNSAPGTLSAWFGAQGSLRAYVVEETPADHPVCRSAACTYPVAAAREARPVFVAPANYAAPPATTLAAPEGRFIVLETVWMRNDGFTWPLPGKGYVIGLTTSLAKETGYPSPSNYPPLAVETPAYALSALEAESGDRIRLDAVPDAGIPPPDLLNRRFSEIEVQPLEFNLRLSLPEPPPAPLAVGETARLLFDVSHLPPPGRDGEKPGDVLPVEITEVSGATADQKAGVTVKIGDPQHSLGLLAWRVQAQRKRGQIAFPSTIMVEFTPHYGRAEGQVLRIPAAALARRGDDAFVWREIKGFALPVWVRALGLIDGDVLVTERTGARGMPVRPDDWRRLSAYQRGETLRAALHPDDARVNHLLAKDTAIVAKPDESLSAGSAIRIGDANL